MRRETVTDAISNIGDKYLKEYFKMDDSFAERRAWRGGRGLRLAAVLISAALLISIIFFIFIPKLQKKAPVPQEELIDAACIFTPGMVCQSRENNTGQYYSIVFTSPYITNEINGRTGNFICFPGEISAPLFTFFVSEPSNFRLDIGITEAAHEKYFVKFEESLSEELSEAELSLDGIPRESVGKLCLVFSIDEERFELIKEKTKDHFKGFYQIELYPPVHWNERDPMYTGENIFAFKTSDVEFKD